MSDSSKVTPFHLQRQAVVYVRQSTASQVENNQESTQRQYALAVRAEHLGWEKDQVVVIDEDLGVSGSGLSERGGVHALDGGGGVRPCRAGARPRGVAGVARNNADWYRLLDLCGVTDTGDRRLRRPLAPGLVQRPAPGVGIEGHDERGRAAHACGSRLAGWDP